MHPIVILVFLFMALGALGYLWLTKSALVLGPLGAIRHQFGLSDGLVMTVILGLIAAYIAYQIYAIMRTANLNRQANQRMRDSMKEPVQSQYVNRQ